MDLNLGATSIFIDAKNFDKAIDCFKERFADDKNITVENMKTIDDIFDEFGYNVFSDDDGNVVELDNISSDLPDGQEKFFDAIAPVIKTGSYVCLKREDTHWMFLFENGKVRKLDSEIIFYDKPMTYDRAMCILSEIVEHTCAARKTNDAVEHLFRLGFTDDELVNVFNFSQSDVESVVKKIEEA